MLVEGQRGRIPVWTSSCSRMSHSIIYDKSQVCLDFILEQLKQQPQKQDKASVDPPLILGLNGIQGSGKTTLVCIPILSNFLTSLLRATR